MVITTSAAGRISSVQSWGSFGDLDADLGLGGDGSGVDLVGAEPAAVAAATVGVVPALGPAHAR
jgi:hypothetical protein